MSFLLRSENWPVGWLLYALVAAAFLYALGGRRTVKTNRLRSAAFYCGLATLALAVASPVDAYSDRLFWAHMTQHVLLTMVAPPLLLLGRPWPRMLKPFAPSVRRPVARAVLVGTDPRAAAQRRPLARAGRCRRSSRSRSCCSAGTCPRSTT